MRRLGGGGGVGFHPKSEDKGHGKRHKVNKQTIKPWGRKRWSLLGNWKAGGEEGREKCIGTQHAAEARQLFAGYVVVGVARMLGGETGRGEEVGSLTSNHGRLGVATQVLAQQPCEGRVTVRDKLLLVLLSLALAGVCRHQGMVMRVYICVHACVYVFVRACVCACVCVCVCGLDETERERQSMENKGREQQTRQLCQCGNDFAQGGQGAVDVCAFLESLARCTG